MLHGVAKSQHMIDIGETRLNYVAMMLMWSLG